MGNFPKYGDSDIDIKYRLHLCLFFHCQNQMYCNITFYIPLSLLSVFIFQPSHTYADPVELEMFTKNSPLVSPR